nr:hypothetical protein [uncultured Mucilaginibacter sp.]
MNNTRAALTIAAATIVKTTGLTLPGGRALTQQNAFRYGQYADNLTPVNPAYSLLDRQAP